MTEPITIPINALVISLKWSLPKLEDHLRLIESIKDHGLFTPLIVRQQYIGGPLELVDGYHRYMAAKAAGLRELPVEVIDAEIQIMPSIHKPPTEPKEYRKQLQRMLDRDPTMSIPKLATKLGKSTTWLVRILKGSSMKIPLTRITNSYTAMNIVDTESPTYKQYEERLRKVGYFRESILIRKISVGYEVIDGNYRLVAARQCLKKSIAATVIECDDEQMCIEQMRRNRRGYTDEEYSQHIKRILMCTAQTTLMELAEKINRTSSWVSNIVCPGLDGNPYREVISGRIPLMSGIALSKLPHHEQMEWVDRAKTLYSRAFVMLINERVADLKQEDYRNKLYGDTYGKNPCSEIPAVSPAGLKDEIGTMRIMMQQAVAKIDISQFHAAINPCGEITLHHKAKVWGDCPSELAPPVKSIITEVKQSDLIVEVPCQPPAPDGWDRVTVGGLTAYCYGVLLIKRIGNGWRITETGIHGIGVSLSFKTPALAATWAEEHLDG